MGMFDYYLPAVDINCPICGTPLKEWQGKDGACALFVWQEGNLAPIEQQVDDEVKLAPSDREHFRLPEQFLIYSYDCNCPFPVEAICRTRNGTWRETRLITADNAVQKHEETRAHFKSRLHWLQGKRTTT